MQFSRNWCDVKLEKWDIFSVSKKIRKRGGLFRRNKVVQEVKKRLKQYKNPQKTNVKK